MSRDTDLEPPQIVSATVESLAENLTDSVVAPLLYFALFGLPGALVYRAINTMDAMIGYHGELEYVGKPAARLDDAGQLAAGPACRPAAGGRRRAAQDGPGGVGGAAHAAPPLAGPNKLWTIAPHGRARSAFSSRSAASTPSGRAGDRWRRR